MIHQQTISHQEILEALDRGVTIVTGNKRLAIATRQNFEQSAIENKKLEAWLTPDIVPWNVWLQRIWEDVFIQTPAFSTPERLLTLQQEHVIWNNIISDCLTDHPLQHLSATISRAQQAWQLIQSWQLPLDQAVFQYNNDSQEFWKWASRFETICKDHGWLPTATLASRLQPRIQAGDLPIPSELIFIGFDEFTPQQQSLLRTIIESGCEVRWVQLTEKQSKAAKINCIDPRQETLTIARWVRQRLENNAETTIGIVIPDLKAQRDIMIRALDEILVAPALQPGKHSVTRPYNISLGLPLADHPVISTALNLLEFLGKTIYLENLGKVIRSPFLAGWEQEASQRALLDRRLRETTESSIKLKTLYYHASKPDTLYYCPILTERIGAWIIAVRDIPQTTSPGQWSEHITQLYTLLGWVNGRPLSSEEYQATEAWRHLFGQFSGLELVTKTMSRSTAVTQLRHMAAERTFQPQSGTVPVQVLGVLEANGLEFDQLWIMGMHDQIWPASPHPNPFIPLPIQRKFGLPHSSVERELQVSHATTTRLLKSASEVIISYPQHNGDEEQRPSPLIADLPELNEQHLQLYLEPTWQDKIRRNQHVTDLTEDPAPPFENQKVSGGGSSVFKLQAACPFRAFAELRLGARGLGQADIGLNPMVRGSLIHAVLEKVWNQLKSHQQLTDMDYSDLTALVKTQVEETISDTAKHYPQTLTGRYRQLETERLCQHTLDWLELEKQRTPFQVIENEGQHQVTAGGITVRLKIDRIDQLKNDKQIVIDYKTGKVTPNQWFGERPEEPQLPLYSMALDADIAGVLFAQLQTGAFSFKGVTEREELIPAVQSYRQLKQTKEMSSWKQVLHEWESTMNDLGKAFADGEAWVDPKHNPGTCRYCELQALCRIHELSSNLDNTEQPS